MPFGRTLSALRHALGSLKLRITLGAIAGLALGIGLSTALLVRQAEHDTLSAQRNREVAETARTAGVLSRRVVELQRALQATAARLDRATLDDAERLAAFIESQPVLRGQFANLFAADSDGRMRVVADAAGVRRPESNLADRDYFRRTLAEQRSVISEPVAGRVSGQPVIVFSAPLRAEGRVFGLFGGALRLSSRELLDDMVNGLSLDDNALVIVSDASGRILAHPSPERVLQSLSGEPRMAKAFAQWVGAGSAAEPSGLHLLQADELVSAAGVAGTDWMVWRAIPTAELLAPLRAARQQALGWAAGLVVLVSLGTLLLLAWLLRPLTQLEHRAQHLFDGSQDPHAGWPDAAGELGRLARVLRHVGAERAQLESFNTGLLQKLGSVMSAAPVGIAFTRNKRFELVSAEFCQLIGCAEHELLGQLAHIVYVSYDDYESIGSQALAAFAAGEPYLGEWQLKRADGTRFWAQLRGRPVEPGNPNAGAIWTVNDIGEQIAARQLLEWSATHDSLTGLANRKMFDRRLAAVFEARPRSVPAAIVMVDLDHFKPINDNAGHAAGDAMLQAVAAAISPRVRAGDLVARLGGDEFALLLERCEPDAALRVAGHVRDAIAGIALPWSVQTLRVGASVGVAMLGAEARDAAAWLAAADAACYEAKALGRGRVQLAVRPLLRVEIEGVEFGE